MKYLKAGNPMQEYVVKEEDIMVRLEGCYPLFALFNEFGIL